MKNAVQYIESLDKKQLLALLEKQRVAHEKALDSQARQQAQQLLKRETRIQHLEEQIRLLTTQQYGARTERRTSDAQSDLFNEAEEILESEPLDESVDETAPTETADTETVSYTRRKSGGRKPLPAELPRQDIEHDIPEADKTCACGCQKQRIGAETSERLEFIPAKLFVERHIRHKYACPDCEDGVQTANKPAALIPKSNAGPGLLAYVVTAKYQDSLPLYRQSKIFARHGLELPRNTLASWVVRCGQSLDPLLQRLEAGLKSAPVILMDETTLQVNKEPDRAASTKSQMWIRRGLAPPVNEGDPPRDITLYHYSSSRSGTIASELLAGYSGALMTDGYAGYNAAVRRYHLQHAQCWAHARRKFIEAEKSLPKGKKAPAIKAILNDIGKLYGIERRLASQSTEDKARIRQAEAGPELDKLKTKLEQKLLSVTPKSRFGKAIAYTLERWSGLTVYLQNGHLPIDNNGAENGIRPFVIGRKNWMFADSVNGARASAALYSLIETAKASGVEPFHYLKHIFARLPLAATDDEYDQLLPWNAKPNIPIV